VRGREPLRLQVDEQPAAVRWHVRLELETPMLTLAESQFALAALTMLGDGRRDAT
jgi:hypothetical protein